MIKIKVRPVYQAEAGRRDRLTLISACRDAARAVVYRMAQRSGDDISDLMYEKKQQIDRVAKMMERRFKRKSNGAHQ